MESACALLYCRLWPVRLYHILPHYVKNGTILGKKLIEHKICGNKMPTRCNRGFIADLIACSTCFGHHHAHHQELKEYYTVVAACGISCCGFQVAGLVWS